GGGYVPLEPGYPKERIGWMVEDSGVEVVLTESHLRRKLEGLRGGVEVIEVGNWEERGEEEGNLGRGEVGVGREHLAYVIYTSGSTGRPKGVLVEHGNVVRLFRATRAWFEFGEDDIWCLFHSYAFDFSVW